jgi:protein-disulfide isomerase
MMAKRSHKLPKRASQRLLFLLACICLTAVAALGLAAAAHSHTASYQPARMAAAPDLIIGSPMAKVTLVEYGDFHCPSCGAFFTSVEPKIRSNYIDKGLVKLDYRVFPWVGPDSVRAGAAAYCANDEGMFAPYHDSLYREQGAEHGTVFTPANLKQIAASVGLNAPQFDSCFDSGKYAQISQGGIASAENNGIDATPTFFIGGHKVVGAQSYATFETLLNEQL